MKRFYMSIDIDPGWGNNGYQGRIFVGVSFRDKNGSKVNSKKEIYQQDTGTLKSTSASLVCGTETNTESEWTPVVGSIKGSYIVRISRD